MPLWIALGLIICTLLFLVCYTLEMVTVHRIRMNRVAEEQLNLSQDTTQRFEKTILTLEEPLKVLQQELEIHKSSEEKGH